MNEPSASLAVTRARIGPLLIEMHDGPWDAEYIHRPRPSSRRLARDEFGRPPC